MKKVVSLVQIIALVCLNACTNSPKELAPAGYVKFMEDPDHGMIKTIESGNLIYNVQLVSPEYVVSRELGNGPENNKGFRKRLDELKGTTFFFISIGQKEGKTGYSRMADPEAANEMAMYFDQAAASDISLLSGDDELKPITYHFENNYGLAPYNRIVVAFKTEGETSDEYQLVFDDRFNDNPSIKAGFSRKAILQLPKLIIN